MMGLECRRLCADLKLGRKKKKKLFFFRQKHKRRYVLIQMGGWILNAGLSKTVDREYDD